MAGGLLRLGLLLGVDLGLAGGLLRLAFLFGCQSSDSGGVSGLLPLLVVVELGDSSGLLLCGARELLIALGHPGGFLGLLHLTSGLLAKLLVAKLLLGAAGEALLVRDPQRSRVPRVMEFHRQGAQVGVGVKIDVVSEGQHHPAGSTVGGGLSDDIMQQHPGSLGDQGGGADGGAREFDDEGHVRAAGLPIDLKRRSGVAHDHQHDLEVRALTDREAYGRGADGVGKKDRDNRCRDHQTDRTKVGASVPQAGGMRQGDKRHGGTVGSGSHRLQFLTTGDRFPTCVIDTDTHRPFPMGSTAVDGLPKGFRRISEGFPKDFRRVHRGSAADLRDRC